VNLALVAHKFSCIYVVPVAASIAIVSPVSDYRLICDDRIEGVESSY